MLRKGVVCWLVMIDLDCQQINKGRRSKEVLRRAGVFIDLVYDLR